MKYLVSKEDSIKIGVYKIVNLINGKIYIGSTGNSFYNRFHQHVSDYKKGKHNGVALRRAFDKYGIKNFCFSIVCICNEKDRLKLEQFYIDKGVDYNSSMIAGSLLGYKHPEYSKTRLVKGGLHHCAKPVYQFNIEGDLIKMFTSIIEAVNFIGKTKNSISHITQSCIGKTYSAFGFRWSFTDSLAKRDSRLGKHLIRVSKDGVVNEFVSHAKVVEFFIGIGFDLVKQGAVSNAISRKNKLYKYKIEKICATL